MRTLGFILLAVPAAIVAVLVPVVGVPLLGVLVLVWAGGRKGETCEGAWGYDEQEWG